MMEQQEVYRQVMEYIKAHSIPYQCSVDQGVMQLTMSYGTENAPGKYVESCIWFYSDGMEARIYYSAIGAELCRKSAYKDRLLRILNYINARAFLCCADGSGRNLYQPHMLYTPRMYLTEDEGYDITATTIIPYDFFELAPIETLDYVMCFCPELLDRLSFAIYGTLLGKLMPEEAISEINNELGLSYA